MEKAYKYIERDLNLKSGDSVVIAVSGGPDSMALLHLLVNVKKVFNISIICAHVNHNVRKESAGELEFVKSFCMDNEVIFESMIIKNYGDDNFHNEAREIRYRFFSDIVQKYQAKYLFTAHHSDDLMETILMRVQRGSTLKGYAGFAKEVDMKTYKIVRPLIEYTKEDILLYIQKNNLKYATDNSNSKDDYTRNRYRKYIVPQLKKESKNANEKFYKFSNVLLECDRYISLQVKSQLKIVCPDNILNIEEFLKCDSLIQIRVIYFMLEQYYQDDLILITDHHVQLINNLIVSKKGNAVVDLPNEVQAIKTYNKVVLVKNTKNETDYEIEIDEYVNLPNGKNIKKILESDIVDNFVCFLNTNEIILPLTVRNRHDGDKMSVKGMLGNKKINDIFIDCKVPLKQRDEWPIVVDAKNDIVWLPGLKKSKFDKTKSEKYDIILKYY